MSDGAPARTRVVIAGGGTAGWLSAAALAKQLGPLLDITLVESEEIGTVGVGEATIPTVRSFHTLLGLDERAFVAATGATFKLGIAFENWARDGDRYVHAFGEIGKSTWIAPFHHFWLEAHARGFGGELSDYCLELQAAEAGRFVTSDAGGPSYAYHLDATRYARLLRTRAEADGVTRIEGRIARVERAGEEIAALVLQSGARVEGDLFVDCTGFRALLIGEALGVSYEDWRHWLPTDRAIAVQTAGVRPPVPYTRAVAHDAGWRWQIPLQHRVGNGIVYASAHLSDDEARARLLASVADEGGGEVLTEPRVIRYVTGRREAAWAANCVALGLSSGFVEPLESTSIHLIMIGITRLIQLFPFAGSDEGALRTRYNAQAQVELEGVRDFVIAHYHLTERDEAFWRERREMPVSDTLAERIEAFRERAHAWQDGADLFRVDSWVQVLMGQRLWPRAHHRVGALMGEARLREALPALKAGITAAVAAMPSHQAFIAGYAPEPRGEADRAA